MILTPNPHTPRSVAGGTPSPQSPNTGQESLMSHTLDSASIPVKPGNPTEQAVDALPVPEGYTLMPLACVKPGTSFVFYDYESVVDRLPCSEYIRATTSSFLRDSFKGWVPTLLVLSQGPSLDSVYFHPPSRLCLVPIKKED